MNTNKFSLKDLDIYGTKIGFFYKSRDKITSYFDIFLTTLYILSFFFLFIFLAVRSMTKLNFKVYDSSKYSETVPTVSLNHDNFYFAFGIEDKETFKRFIDESIYSVSVIYKIKQKINNVWISIEEKTLETERCKLEKFSEKHQKLFGKNELNTSYCIKDITNQTLTGSYIYNIISYFYITISPCINSTKNKNICKPQNIIDEYISGAYATIDMQDIGILPDNYSNPTTPLIHNIGVSVDKKYLQELIITPKIVEIKTDNGLISENIKTENYLQSDKETSNLISRDESQYNKGEPIFRLLIRLSDKINSYKRVCNKLSEVLATAGGYMQLFSNIFTVMSFLFSRFNSENILINELFNFNLTEQKIILKNYKNDKKIFFSNDIKKGLNETIQNFSLVVQKTGTSENKLLLIKNPTVLKISDDNINKSIIFKTFNRNSNIKNISLLNKKNNESSLFKMNRNNDAEPMSFVNEKILKSSNKLFHTKNNDLSGMFKDLNVEAIEKINYNWFEYYIGRYCLNSKPKEYLNLYENGKEMLKFQLDIINMFTYILINKEFIKGIVNSKLIE